MADLSLTLLASGAGGGGSITDVNVMLFWLTLVLFAIFAGVLARFGWRPLLAIIAEREQSVRTAVEEAHKANADARALLAQHKELLRDAGREREEILKRALQEAERLKGEVIGDAKAEAEKTIQRARAEIERQKVVALAELRTQVADLAVEAAAKIVVSSLTPETQRQLVDEFIDNLPRLQ
jgi:F-type H+-transporting ATPase subunit b